MHGQIHLTNLTTIYCPTPCVVYTLPVKTPNEYADFSKVTAFRIVNIEKIFNVSATQSVGQYVVALGKAISKILLFFDIR